MAERALLIVNPRAGKRTASDRDLPECVKLLTEAGFEVETVETGRVHDAAELAEHGKRDGFRAIFVAGGDGTVALAAKPLLDSGVTLGVLPFGSYMNIANGLGIPLTPIDAARVIARREVKRCDVGEVDGRSVFFETAGVGLDADAFGAARLMERQRWTAAFRRVRRWATASPRSVELVIDGAKTRHDVMQVLVVNSPFYAWALPLVPRADMTDGVLEIAVFPRMGRRQLVRSLVELALQGRPGTPPLLKRGRVIEISSSDPLAVHADGQIAGRLPVTVRCRAGALRVFA
jgi:YegS/Rv2252/BmrU family lipid kinase